MELTYWSVFFLPCIFLDWTFRTSAEEGKSDDAWTFLWLQFFLPTKPNTPFKRIQMAFHSPSH